MSGRLNAGLLVRKGWASPAGRSPAVGAASEAMPDLWHLPLRDAAAIPEVRHAGLGQRQGGMLGIGSTRLGGQHDDRIALTLRMDRGRHTRLKIVAARTGQSVQALMLAALDTCLADNGPDCACVLDRNAACGGRECGRQKS